MRCRPCERSRDPPASCSLVALPPWATSPPQTQLSKAQSPSLAFDFSPQLHPDLLSKHPLTRPAQEPEVPHKTKISAHTNPKGNNRARGGAFGVRGSASPFRH